MITDQIFECASLTRVVEQPVLPVGPEVERDGLAAGEERRAVEPAQVEPHELVARQRRLVRQGGCGKKDETHSLVLISGFCPRWLTFCSIKTTFAGKSR